MLKYHKIKDTIWQWMRKNGDKGWHYTAFITFALILLKVNVWVWLFWTLTVGGAIGKELYDWKLGEEKKFDWLDLAFSLTGVVLAVKLT